MQQGDGQETALYRYFCIHMVYILQDDLGSLNPRTVSVFQAGIDHLPTLDSPVNIDTRAAYFGLCTQDEGIHSPPRRLYQSLLYLYGPSCLVWP
jgi:hypothetical protein